MAPFGTLPSPTMDSASKRKRTNRLAKLKQCKLEARRERWLSHQEHREGEEIVHAGTCPNINDPGEVLHPGDVLHLEPAETKTPPSTNSTITWAALLNSSISSPMQQNPQKTQLAPKLSPSAASEPDPDLLCLNSTSQVNLRIKRTDQKSLCRDTRPGFTCDDCADADVSPKSCDDRSPKSKASKVGRGPRRSRGRRRNSKENMYFDNLEIGGKPRQFEGKGVHTHQQEHMDGWEAAADSLGLHSAQKKNFSNVLQPQAPPFNNHGHSRTTSAPLLGSKPSKHQPKTHGRAWIQGDSRRPTFLTNTTKQQSCGVDVHSLTLVNDVSEKLQCLVCTEDLDITDTSFEGCECGFNICLFCYHKIAQETGRCPGCRGVYKQDITAKPVCLLPR